MTELEINMAIAKALGKQYHKPTDNELLQGSYYQHEPSYTGDLNACHEMEKTLDTENQVFFIAELFSILGIDSPSFTSEARPNDFYFKCCHATAQQRCEAFLRVNGLWKD